MHSFDQIIVEKLMYFDKTRFVYIFVLLSFIIVFSIVYYKLRKKKGLMKKDNSSLESQKDSQTVVIFFLSGAVTWGMLFFYSVFLDMTKECGIYNSFRDYFGILALCLILISCVFSWFIEELVFKIELDTRTRSTIRLTESMITLIYLIIVIVVYDELNDYGSIVLMYSLMVIGRFVFVDMSFQGIKNDLIRIYQFKWFILFVFICTGVFLAVGICMKAIEAVDPISDMFVIHIFMCIVASVLKSLTHDFKYIYSKQ